MLFSRQWLARYVDLPETVEELAERLTQAGFAVEGIEPRGDDLLLDIDVTTNRSDCMCHLGLAREVALLGGVALRSPLAELQGEPDSAAPPTADSVVIEVESWSDCPRYVARLIHGIQVGPSPDWLVSQLEALGMRSINNVVDVTNFVLWETGQPLHAFDARKIAGDRIRVRRGRSGETLVTLDGEERKLDEENLLICDAERPLALAGVMGGLDSEVTEGTVDLLIESAHFDPTVVRRGARNLGLHTDASHRFERGADPEVCLAAATRAAHLICEMAGGRLLAGSVDARDPEWDWQLEGELDLARLRAFAGAEIAAADVERWLVALGFDLRPEGSGAWRVGIPSWRFYDFLPTRRETEVSGGENDGAGTVYPADLYEEILRLYGFDNIAATLPAVGGPDGGSYPKWRRRQRIRQQLVACGFAEAISYAFYAPEADARFPVRGTAIELANPLSDLFSVMRRSLLPGLVDSADFNARRGAESVRLYEIGHLFGEEDGESWEVESVALVAGGVLGRPWDGPQELDFHYLKGAMEVLAADFDLELDYRPAALSGFLEGAAADILLAGDEPRVVGHMGCLLPTGSRYPLVAAELFTEALGEMPRTRSVRAHSRFPGIEVDLTLTHDLSVPWAEIEATIAGQPVEELAAFGLKDRYTGQGVPTGAVNSTIYFRYNSMDHSLTQQEVNDRHATLTRELTERFGRKG